eukprot:TRINITY_DN13624_c0_g1_i4.p1 TRINITY_DN13624_c0_g1~~TRINITY_DN13624_c0_g1_i4.p1  ORF type:complete len:193 (+),score=9.61 TRINITY_DN13624_c0_g1_i4:494-1072(+)
MHHSACLPARDSLHLIHMAYLFCPFCCFSLPLSLSSVILAYAIVISLMANFALVCGFYIQRENIPPYWIWLHYLSPVKYAYEAVTLNEFDRPSAICYQPAADIFSTTPLGPLVNATDVQKSLSAMHPTLAHTQFANVSTTTCLLNGPELVTYSMGLTQLSKWECVAVLFGLGLGLRLMHFLLLVRLSKTKRQ